jgi:hypothetical protein
LLQHLEKVEKIVVETNFFLKMFDISEKCLKKLKKKEMLSNILKKCCNI